MKTLLVSATGTGKGRMATGVIERSLVDKSKRNTQKHTRKVKSKEDHMSRKLFTLLSAITGALATIAVAVVTYVNPPLAVAINASIGIAVTERWT